MGVGGTFGKFSVAAQHLFDARVAGRMMKAGWAGGGLGGTLGVAGVTGANSAARSTGKYAGAIGGARDGLLRWAWPRVGANLGAKRATRAGSLAAGVFLAGNIINPRDNFGPF